MASYDFIHLDSMQELADWNPESSFQHVTNVSNTPLQRRPTLAPKFDYAPTEDPISRVLVCHDFKGGYHPSESSQGRLPFNETVYTAEYLQYVSTFVYFSHRRVTIPPAPWINLMHRNGVKVLGTFIVEHDEGSAEIKRILEKGSEGEFLFATQLARIAETYGFDGWLINLESSFPGLRFSPSKLQKFLRELMSATKALVPGSEIIWYDALTVLNQVHWQNGLTLLNVPYFAATDAIFTNYGWREAELHHTALMSRVMLRPCDIYAGIDCFGRGSLGDGGFGVGTALAEIRKEGLSAALFAPGWTFENFDGKDFHTMDRRFWVGDGTGTTGPGPGPVSDFTVIRESGSEHYFYTNFNRGFGNALWLKGEKILDIPWVHIGAQSILPSFYSQSKDALKWEWTNKLAYTGNWSLSILATLPSAPSGGEYSCPLYKLGVRVTRDLILQFTYQLPASTGETVGFYCDIVSGCGRERVKKTRNRYDLIESTPMEESEGWVTAYMPVLENIKDKMESHVVEVGIFYKAPVATLHTGNAATDFYPRPGVPTHVVTLGEILFTTPDTENTNQPSFISSGVPSYTEGDRKKAKVSWSVYATGGSDIAQKKREQGMWSNLTKDFAWFVVWKGSEFVGVSHCLEFILDDLIERKGWGNEDLDGEPGKVEWRVDGVTWEGAVFSGP